jgi:hypothetical protein
MRRCVGLTSFGRMVRGVGVMAVRHKRVVACLLMMARVVVLRRFAMMSCRVLVMFGRAPMVLRALMGCHTASENGMRRGDTSGYAPCRIGSGITA